MDNIVSTFLQIAASQVGAPGWWGAPWGGWGILDTRVSLWDKGC